MRIFRKSKLGSDTQDKLRKISRLLNSMRREDFADPLQQEAFDLVKEFYSEGKLFATLCEWLRSPTASTIGQAVDNIEELSIEDLNLKLQIYLQGSHPQDQQNSAQSRVFEFSTLFLILLENPNFARSVEEDKEIFKREFLLTALQSNLNNIRGGRVSAAGYEVRRALKGESLLEVVNGLADSGKRACSYIESIQGATFYREVLADQEKDMIDRHKAQISNSISQMQAEGVNGDFLELRAKTEVYLQAITTFDEYLKHVECRVAGKPLPTLSPAAKLEVKNGFERANSILCRFGKGIQDFRPELFAKYQATYNALVKETFLATIKADMLDNLAILMLMESTGHDIIGQVNITRKQDVDKLSNALKVLQLNSLISPLAEKALTSGERNEVNELTIRGLAEEIKSAMNYGTGRSR